MNFFVYYWKFKRRGEISYRLETAILNNQLASIQYTHMLCNLYVTPNIFTSSEKF